MREGERARTAEPWVWLSSAAASCEREPPEDVRQMDLNRPLGDEQSLRDLSVGRSLGRHLGDARSLGVSDSTPLRATRRARAPLASSSVSDRAARAAAPQIDASSTARRRCSLGPGRADQLSAARLPARCAPWRVLELRRGAAQHLDRLTELREPGVALGVTQAARARGATSIGSGGGAHRPAGPVSRPSVRRRCTNATLPSSAGTQSAMAW
jgi:hypothetical protein